MAEQEFSITSNGGIEIKITDDDGTERAVILEPYDDGTIDIQGRGPNGESAVGTIAPGGGSTSLGQ